MVVWMWGFEMRNLSKSDKITQKRGNIMIEENKGEKTIVSDTHQDEGLEVFMGWIGWLLFFCLSIILLFSGMEVLLKGSGFGFLSLALGAFLFLSLIKTAIKHKRDGGFKKLKPKSIFLYTGYVAAFLLSFILLFSEVFYPLVNKEEHALIKDKSYIVQSELRTLYVFDTILFHGFFANLQEISKVIKSSQCLEDNNSNLGF